MRNLIIASLLAGAAVVGYNIGKILWIEAEVDRFHNQIHDYMILRQLVDAEGEDDDDFGLDDCCG